MKVIKDTKNITTKVQKQVRVLKVTNVNPINPDKIVEKNNRTKNITTNEYDCLLEKANRKRCVKKTFYSNNIVPNSFKNVHRLHFKLMDGSQALLSHTD